MIQYIPCGSNVPTASFFKEVGYATKSGVRISFAEHTTTGECRIQRPDGFEYFDTIEQMREAARRYKRDGWSIAKR